MKVKLILNIGTSDARRLQLTKTAEGEVVDVEDAVGNELLDRKWAVREDGKRADGRPAPTSTADIDTPNVANSAPTPTESPRAVRPRN